MCRQKRVILKRSPVIRDGSATMAGDVYSRKHDLQFPWCRIRCASLRYC